MTLHPWMTHARQLGWPGGVGLLLLCLAVLAHTQWLPAMAQTEQDLAQQVRRTRHELKAKTDTDGANAQAGDAASAPQPQSPQAVWQAAWQALPSDAEQRRMLALISRAAEQHQLSVPSIQYSGQDEAWSKQADQVLWRQRVSMPVEGRYADIRAWLARLLDQSHISLDSLDLTRVDTASDGVRAQVQLSLWWRRTVATRTGGQP